MNELKKRGYYFGKPVVKQCGSQKKEWVMLPLCTVSGSHRLALRTAVLVSGLSYVLLSRNF
jgi:hypothetical protein